MLPHNRFHFLVLVIILYSFVLLSCGSESNKSETATISGILDTGTSSILQVEKQTVIYKPIVGNAAISVYNRHGVLLNNTTSDIDGNFTVQVPPGSDYFIKATSSDNQAILSCYIATVSASGISDLNVNAYTSSIVYILEQTFNTDLGAENDNGIDISINLSQAVENTVQNTSFDEVVQLVSSYLQDTSSISFAEITDAILSQLDIISPANTTINGFIDNETNETASTSVTLLLSAIDDNGVVAYFISESSKIPTSTSNWINITPSTTYADTVPFTLSYENGDKSVYVWFKDVEDNISDNHKDTIILNNPYPININNIEDGKTYGGQILIKLNNIIDDITYEATLNGDPFPLGTPFKLEGEHQLIVTLKDINGTILRQITINFTIDLQKPFIPQITKLIKEAPEVNLETRGDTVIRASKLFSNSIKIEIANYSDDFEYIISHNGTPVNLGDTVSTPGENRITIKVTSIVNGLSGETRYQFRIINKFFEFAADFGVTFERGAIPVAPRAITLSNGNYVNFFTDSDRITAIIRNSSNNLILHEIREGYDPLYTQISDAYAFHGGNFILITHNKFLIYDNNGSRIKVKKFNSQYEEINAKVAVLKDDRFVIAQQNPDNSGYGIFYQIFDKNGNKLSERFQANETRVLDQTQPNIIGTSDGGFVICWQSLGVDGDKNGIVAKRFDLNGIPDGNEFIANSMREGDQIRSDISELPNGNIVISWLLIDTTQATLFRIFDQENNPLFDDYKIDIIGAYSTGDSKIYALPGDKIIIIGKTGQIP